MQILKLSWESGVTFRIGEFDGGEELTKCIIGEEVKWVIYKNGFDDFVGVGNNVEEFKEELLGWFVADCIKHRISVYGVLEVEAGMDLEERKEWMEGIDSAIKRVLK